MESYLQDLNEQQLAAVRYDGGPALVIAGAGSGKTRVLTNKIMYLVQNGYSPARILALTFTNKAAREMKDRIAQLVFMPYEQAILTEVDELEATDRGSGGFGSSGV